MGDFRDLSRVEQQIEYERGFRDGYFIELRQQWFLRVTKVGTMTSRVWGWLARKQYSKLFDRPWKWKSRGG